MSSFNYCSMSLSSTVLNLGGTRPRTRWLANIPTGKYACVVLVMYAPYAYEGACACVRPPEHIYYGPLVVDILTLPHSIMICKSTEITIPSSIPYAPQRVSDPKVW